jgi:hypothetical protein
MAVVAEDAVRALAFERGKLSQLFHDEAEVCWYYLSASGSRTRL